MKLTRALFVLSILTAVLAALQAGAGLFWPADGAPFTFTTLHGQEIEMYGQGLYRNDTAFKAPINRGTDTVTLFVAVPLLVAGLWAAKRGSLRGRVFLTAVLSYFLYSSLSVATGTAYNNLFLLYIAYFSVSLFAFILAFTSIDSKELAARVSAAAPLRGMAILLFVGGAAVLFAWLSDLISWLQPGVTPRIASYTTEVTHVYDLGVIAPLCFLAGYWLLQRVPLGYLLGAVLSILLAIIGAIVSIQTAFQISAGIELTPGEMVGKVGSFVILSLFAAGLSARLLLAIGAPAQTRRQTKQAGKKA